MTESYENVNSQDQTNHKVKNKFNLIIGGSLLVTGTCIGAGMIGLPVKTAACGFYPSVILFIAVWILMTFTALCMLEATFYVKGETNLISMAHATLGKLGGNLAWVFYIVFLYSVMAAYTAGGSTMFADLFGFKIDDTFDLIKAILIFVLPFGVFVYIGAKCVDYVNRILMVCLIAAYISLLFFVKADVNLITSFNAFGENKYILFTLPILITAFGYHLLIPTLKYYLQENIQILRTSIILGGLLPLIIYIFWEYEILSLISAWGDDGLVAMLHKKENPAELIIRFIKNDNLFIKTLIGLFSIFALISSFIGVGLGIFDFFADGLKIKKNHKGRFILALITFLPPALYTIAYPGGFMLALGYAGAFAAILLIIYPAIMVWSGRYVKNFFSKYKVKGGKISLILVIFLGMLIIALEIFEQFHLLPIPKV